MKKEYTLTIYTENHIGLITKISILFARRKINIESLNTSPSEIKNIYRFTLVILETEEKIKNLARQLEKLIDVLKVYYNTNEEIIWQQMALYKVPTSITMKEVKVERLLREYGARAIVIREDYTVFETTGQQEEIEKLLKKLKEYQLIEFVRSSRIAIIKASEGIHKKVLDIEKNDPSKLLSRIDFTHREKITFEL
ncbi:acetolactate synthase small subunit [Flavobacterium sediminilitoris]|uniref:Acetolactate synthase small subunit n=1 Tax=Flavobacterium sediminilitoris TaxID=2024526 RepID=A0ABY4HH64_9FLAO|nr:MULTISPECIES: acetolactate synthase small subunit [Flavobacterium]UOX32190.1 acetolactate synthase small subunit [Flavobacterium sediminilitoris]